MNVFAKEILHYFFRNGYGTITELANAIGASIPTTTKALEELEGRNLIKTFGKISTSSGRSPFRWGLNPDAGYFVGVDIRKDHIDLAICDLTGEIRREEKIAAIYENTQEFFILLCDTIRNFIDHSDAYRKDIISANVNISGRVNAQKGASYSIFKFENNDAPLAEMFHRSLEVPTSIENDTRAMAYSELMLGAGKKHKDFLYINASWGLGLSIITNGQIYRGRDGYSGELGHIHAFDNNIICHCGKKGCLETEVSGKALCRKLMERLKNGESSRLNQFLQNPETLSEMQIIEAAIKHEDPVAIELLEEAGLKLGEQLANLINIFNPEAIIIGGTLATAGDYFLSPIELAAKRYSLRRVYQGVQIKTTEIENPGVIGACRLALNRYLEKA